MHGPSSEITPDEQNQEQLLQALESVLTSGPFAEVFRLRRFLEYVVKETVEGRSDRLKGFVIACDVFDKKDPTDAQTTTVVRVEAGRLRRRLKDYYDTEGAADPIQISIPKGAYAACFHRVTPVSKPTTATQAEGSPNPNHRNPVLWLAGAVIIILFSLIAWQKKTDEAPLPELSTIGQPLIAVMPFQNLSGSSVGDPVAIALTEDIVIDLQAISSIDVTSISSVWTFGDGDTSPRDIGARLGAKYIVRASIRELPPAPHITAGMFDTDTGHQIWAEHFEDNSGDFRNLQRELIRKMAASLSADLDVSDTNVFGQRFTTNKEAWQLYKQAMDLANPPSDPKRLELAGNAFENVIAMDPDFAGGYAGSAYILAFRLFFRNSIDRESDLEMAFELVRKALSLDPTFGLAYSAQAFLYISGGDFKNALLASESAVEIHPNNAYINAYHGFIRGAAGDLRGGIPFVERALRLDPLNARSPYLNILGVLNFLAGDFSAARDFLIQNQDRGGPGSSGHLRFLAACYSKLGQDALAESILSEADKIPPEEEQWREWLFSSFADPDVPLRVINEVEAIQSKTQN